MRWINLSDKNRQPDWESIDPIIRALKDDVVFHASRTDRLYTYDECEDDELPYAEFEGKYYIFDELEWLDESESIHDWGPRLYTQEEVDLMLSIQHRNTRHDAVEVVMSRFHEWNIQNDSLRIQIERDIMNLKQRKP